MPGLMELRKFRAHIRTITFAVYLEHCLGLGFSQGLFEMITLFEKLASNIEYSKIKKM